jgi:type II secretory pathway component PulJ
VTQVLSDDRRTGARDRGQILISTLVATVVGALLALGASLVLVSSASNTNAPPVNKPLITYDQK